MKIREKRAPVSTSHASLELLYNVSREIAAALDLRTVLQRVLFLSMKYVGAISGSLIVLDDQGQPVESAIITGAQFHGETTQQLRATFDRGLAGWVIRNNQAVLVPDTSKDLRWLRRPDDEAGRTGPKSAVSAPIQARERLVGVITLVHPSPGFFTEDHLALMQSIADQAGIAVLNARLYAESQRQARVMTALAESAAAINASLKLDDVLQRILTQISQALQAQMVALALIDSDSQELVYRASTGEHNKKLGGMRLATGRGIAGWVATHGEGMIVPDVRQEERYDPVIDELLGLTTRSVACAPIRSQGQVIGVLEAHHQQTNAFDPDALLVLSGIGSLAGSAIHHAQLFESLQAAHQRYRELFEDSIDPIFITDWSGLILEANRRAADFTGLSEESLHQATIDRLQVVDRDKLGEDYQVLTSGEMIAYESLLQTEGGREIPVQVNVRQVLIDGVSHLQWILRDITERKYLDSLRNDLISMVYHDLRSPLANVVSSLDVLNTIYAPETDPAQKSLLEIAIRSTERIQRLTDSLLDLRRLEAGKPIGNWQPVNPATLARDATDAVLPIIESKNQDLYFLIQDDLPEIWVDADMLRRVFINLLENAVKYTPPGSKIYVGARREDTNILMWVQDTGPGIPPGEHERIFDKFVRLHSRGGPKGLGLGLAFCRLAIEAHGGRIWVEDGPEAGACFKFTLPVNKPPPGIYEG